MTDKLTSADGDGIKPRRRLRRISMGIAGMVLVVVTLVSVSLESFTDEERYSTVDAREIMESQTLGQVKNSREDFNIRQDLPAEVLTSGVEGEVAAFREPSSPPNQIQTDRPSRSLDGSSQTSLFPPEADTQLSPEELLSTTSGESPEFGFDIQGWAPSSARQVEEEPTPEPYSNSHVVSPSLPDGMFDTVLLIGADASGKLADTIMLALFPEDGSTPALVSIPRDLYIPNPCTEDYRRINANLWGCRGGISGPELLGVTIEGFTGVKVDQYVRVDFDGFVELVDGLGGVEICFDYPTHDLNAGLDIAEEGCLIADGAVSLAYVRSRNARQLVDGEWLRAWDSDHVRQRHQRELLLKLAGGLRSSSLIELLSNFQTLSHTFHLDSGWSVAEAVGWAWRYHDLELSQITHLRVSVDGYETSLGELVSVPTRPFNEVLSEWWEPPAR